ncbi:hypothetical protein BSL78_03404 [Apostichopus japonicus]|uniref:Uncharacterized protein n=1 Tax=Stichopus japonicus TaxID=307972 RepID=A0A2G8LHE8_STIJA|nr:hypothetical protein BSL78_03404 [Apostichopus japonicus]
MGSCSGDRKRERNYTEGSVIEVNTRHTEIMQWLLSKTNLKISPNEELITPLEDSDERTIRSLEEQNDALKSVIQRMREEMESLTAASHRPERENSKDGVYTAVRSIVMSPVMSPKAHQPYS